MRKYSRLQFKNNTKAIIAMGFDFLLEMKCIEREACTNYQFLIDTNQSLIRTYWFTKWQDTQSILYGEQGKYKQVHICNCRRLECVMYSKFNDFYYDSISSF